MAGFFKRSKKPISVAALAFAEDKVVLRDERSAAGSRHLTASLIEGGDLIIRGQDLGEQVRAYFGFDEYEWSWTVRRQHFPSLRAALGADDDLLAALKSRFGAGRGDEIGAFLKDNAVPCEFWSRVGD